MTRHLLPLTALLIAPLLLAAPVPKVDPTRRLIETFGEIVDPMSDVKCDMTKAGVLRVTVPKEVRPVELNHAVAGSPVTTKTVEGDFVLTVRVSHTPPNKAEKVDGAKQQATVSAGIAVYSEGDPKTNLTLVHKHTKTGDKWVSGLAMQTNYKQGSTGSGRGGTTLEDKPLYLRLTRKGEVCVAETSADGKKWVQFTRHPADKLGPVVVVGPTVFRNTDADHTAEFDEYEIKSLTEEKK
jgi:hypothetical protein